MVTPPNLLLSFGVLHDSTLAHFKIEYEKAKAQWERSDTVTLMIVDHSIDTAIRGAHPN
jgi:hypothetical protein